MQVLAFRSAVLLPNFIGPLPDSLLSVRLSFGRDNGSLNPGSVCAVVAFDVAASGDTASLIALPSDAGENKSAKPGTHGALVSRATVRLRDHPAGSSRSLK